jgi:hypothetical protein
MKKSLIRFLGGVALISAFYSCSTEEINPTEIESGRAFYPIEIGNFWIYKVDTTAYTFAGEVQKGSYFLREKITDTLFRQEGNLVYRIELARASSPAGPWGVDSVWTIRTDPDKIIKTENNRPYVKLRFPVEEGSRWDGNQFNPLQDSNTVFLYTVKNLNSLVVYENQQRQTVQVIQKIDSNCINKSIFFETYYKNIGLGARRQSFIQYNLSEADACSKPIRTIEIGYDKIFTLISHGKN